MFVVYRCRSTSRSFCPPPSPEPADTTPNECRRRRFRKGIRPGTYLNYVSNTIRTRHTSQRGAFRTPLTDRRALLRCRVNRTGPTAVLFRWSSRTRTTKHPFTQRCSPNLPFYLYFFFFHLTFAPATLLVPPAFVQFHVSATIPPSSSSRPTNPDHLNRPSPQVGAISRPTVLRFLLRRVRISVPSRFQSVFLEYQIDGGPYDFMVFLKKNRYLENYHVAAVQLKR